MINKDLFKLREGFNACCDLKGARFSYIISKNKALVEDEISHLQMARKPSDSFFKAEDERREIIKTYAAKDEKGELILKGKEATFENEQLKQKAICEIDNHRENNLEVYEQQESLEASFNKILEEKCSIELYKIGIQEIPEEISVKQMEMISEIIEE